MNLSENLDTLEETLLPKYDNTENVFFEKQSTLRTLVGTLGMLLPFLLWLLLFIHTGNKSPLDSISHYYYTRVGSIFIIIVSLLAIFLLIYKGYELIDYVLSTVAGISALLLLYFPTSNLKCSSPAECNSVITRLGASPIREYFHFIMAGIFLGSLALMAIFLFTKKTGDNKGLVIPSFKSYNIAYITCGLLMLLSIVFILTNFFGAFSDDQFDERNLTFWFEVLALESFGLAWFIKGIKKKK